MREDEEAAAGVCGRGTEAIWAEQVAEAAAEEAWSFPVSATIRARRMLPGSAGRP